MSALAINECGCVIVDGRCLVHDESELACSHCCDQGQSWPHAMRCDDPPPPVQAAGYASDCIGCGERIPEGAPVRLYEEGYVHAHGCPERTTS